MKLLRKARWVLFGAPISTHKHEHTLLPKRLALPVYASDAISSVAYASQQILLALGAAGLWMASERDRYSFYAMLLSGIVVFLLAIVASSYRQTIFAYPNGGGSYLVSKENLGRTAGLVAAGALLIDYVLTVAVSIAAGVQNLSNIPAIRDLHFESHLVAASLVAISFLTLANLRGVKESGRVFAIFTYGFVSLCYLMIVIGLLAPWIGWTFNTAEIERVYRDFPGGVPAGQTALQGFSLVVLFRAFANGCSAMTGTEAVANGVPIFTEPKSRNAAITLLLMAFILGSLFMGISWLAMQLHVVYWESGGRSAPAVIDQISGAVFGKSGPLSFLYLATQIFTAAILVLAANTAFADFPRLASILAQDGFMPRQLSSLGDKLVFHNGILLLGTLAALLLYAKGGNVDALIPMYAVGVFLAFTLSQFGMVQHWRKHRSPGWAKKAVINGFGGSCTALVLIDIITEKFFDGAWIVLLMLVLLFLLFRAICRHYDYVREQLQPGAATPQFCTSEHIVVVPVSGLHRGVFPALEYAFSISKDCRAVYVEIDPARTAELSKLWETAVPKIPLIVLKSPFRSLLRPLSKYLDLLERESAGRRITVVVPQFVTPSWWQSLLHGNTALLIKLALANRKKIVISNVRFHLPSPKSVPHSALETRSMRSIPA